MPHLAGRNMVQASSAATIQLPVLDALSVGNGASVSTVTVSHTVGASLTNSILIVAVGVGGATTSSNLPTGVTYNGVAMTAVPGGAAASPTATSSSRDTNLFYMLNPPAGAHNIVVTLTTSASGHCAVIGASYQHVNQSTPFGTCGTYANASSNAPTATITSAATTDLDFAAVTSKVFATTPNNSLAYVDDWNDASSAFLQIATKAGSGGTDTCGFSWTTAGDNSMVCVPIHGAA